MQERANYLGSHRVQYNFYLHRVGACLFVRSRRVNTLHSRQLAARIGLGR